MADGAAPHTREASGSPARASNVDERLKDMPEELNEEGREKDRSDYIKDKCDLKHALSRPKGATAAVGASLPDDSNRQ